MFQFEANESIILEQRKALESALSTNPKTQKVLRSLIRKVINQARKEVVGSIHFDNGDPHKSAQSVRTLVYKKVLGANINIYSSRKLNGGAIMYEPPRKGTKDPKGRGGNRMKRSPRTQKFLTKYGPKDRGFILRWVNSGTKGRYAGYGRNGNTDEAYTKFILRHGGKGWRGMIEPRNFFRNAGERALVKAADNLANLIDTELEALLNKAK